MRVGVGGGVARAEVMEAVVRAEATAEGVRVEAREAVVRVVVTVVAAAATAAEGVTRMHRSFRRSSGWSSQRTPSP